MAKLLSTREVSKFLNVNEKMVYTLVSDKGLPATKITGKWLFPSTSWSSGWRPTPLISPNAT